MSKIPTKYMEKMFNEIFQQGKWKSEIKQKSSYYGTNGIVWSMYRSINGFVYLKHYDTEILQDDLNGGYTIMGGWSSTDQTAINGYLYLRGDYLSIKCTRHNDVLSLEY